MSRLNIATLQMMGERSTMCPMTSLVRPLALPPASQQDGSYPRPQLMRSAWLDLGGTWAFRYDDEDRGVDDEWYRQPALLEDAIVVPFPPESRASGIGDTGFHPVVWYHRTVTGAELGSLTSTGSDLVLHFGAVDYRASVWVNGQHAADHEGGHVPFAVPLRSHGGDLEIVVRAEDDPQDLSQPRGKQDWQLEPHGIWYHRTTGIWQPVWLEAVPRFHVAALRWTPDLTAGCVDLDLELDRRPPAGVEIQVHLHRDGRTLARMAFDQTGVHSATRIPLPRHTGGYGFDGLVWSPDAPRLIDAEIRVVAGDGCDDVVASYFGLRSTGWADGHFLLNERPCYIRAVLAQGYWPATHLAAPSAAALRAEVELARDMGFNTIRMHQKIEDPRFLYWTDRLGVMVWGENASAFDFTPAAVRRLTGEWGEAVLRDASHPSIVAWVPLNESWGVQDIARDPAQQSYARSLYHLTKTLDPTRPVVGNDGWEHAESDAWTIHDYSATGRELAASYPDDRTVRALLDGIGPLGRRLRIAATPDTGQPVIVSEFGGITFAAAAADAPTSWGYTTAEEPAAYEEALRDQFRALQESPVLAGFCYTQLADTRQEANGLAGEDRAPKLPLPVIRGIVRGEGVDTSSHRRPKVPLEVPVVDAGGRQTRADADHDEPGPPPDAAQSETVQAHVMQNLLS
jgi:hypothetical protein